MKKNYNESFFLKNYQEQGNSDTKEEWNVWQDTIDIP